MSQFRSAIVSFLLVAVARLPAQDAVSVDATGLRLFDSGVAVTEFSNDPDFQSGAEAKVPTKAAVKAFVDAAVAEDALVHVEASSDAGQHVSTTSTALQYEDEAFDSHGAWVVDQFTAPRDAVYRITAHTNNALLASLIIVKNGQQHTWGAATTYGKVITGAVYLDAGETLSVNTSEVYTRHSHPNHNRLSITEQR